MQSNQLSPYIDWQGPPSLFNNVKKDANGVFSLPISEKEWINHDTLKIVLKFPNKDWIAGLWPGGHFYFHFNVNGETVSRPYTPVTLVNEKGSATFVIKVYRKTAEFPNGGKGTQHLENLKVGDSINMQGPIGYYRYYGQGQFAWIEKLNPHKKTKLGIVAGGTGLTPALSMMAAAVASKDNLDINFLYSNKTKSDILCQDLIDKYKGDRCKINYTLTRHNDEKDGEWTGLRGRITSEMFIELGMPVPADDVFIYFCGPDGMYGTMKAILAELGYKEGNHYY